MDPVRASIMYFIYKYIKKTSLIVKRLGGRKSCERLFIFIICNYLVYMFTVSYDHRDHKHLCKGIKERYNKLLNMKQRIWEKI